MNSFLENLKEMVEEFGSSPTLEEMPRRNLKDKAINGPTAAHVIEEVHTPLNFAYLTFTTGSSAFQNIVGVTFAELENRIKAGQLALKRAGAKEGSSMLFTYPPLANVFSKDCLDAYGIKPLFLARSSRDAFLSSLYNDNPDIIIGESSFLRVAFDDAVKLGIAADLPKGKIILTAGTPLDLDLLPIAEEVMESKINDLYGCQEFGWLTLNGIPLRDDISLVASPGKRDSSEFVVGGLPMGDSFPVSESGHICDKEGKVITYRRERTHPEFEVFVKETTLTSATTINRVARSILRIKGRVVKVEEDVKTSADHTVLELVPAIGSMEKIIIEGPEKTMLFDDMVKAQLDYQQMSKADPVWIKSR